MTVIHKLFLYSLCFLLVSCNSMTAHYSEMSRERERKMTAAKINIRLGIAYLERKNMDRAKQKLLLALEAAPNLPEAYYSMGYFQEATHNYPLANQYYLKAISLAPQSGEAHNNYGTFLCRMEDYEPALEQFNLAVKDPKYLSAAAAYENAGLCSMQANNMELAKTYFEKSLASDPNRIVAQKKLKDIDRLHLVA